jgi:hypothetical protein
MYGAGNYNYKVHSSKTKNREGTSSEFWPFKNGLSKI